MLATTLLSRVCQPHLLARRIRVNQVLRLPGSRHITKALKSKPRGCARLQEVAVGGVPVEILRGKRRRALHDGADLDRVLLRPVDGFLDGRAHLFRTEPRLEPAIAVYALYALSRPAEWGLMHKRQVDVQGIVGPLHLTGMYSEYGVSSG